LRQESSLPEKKRTGFGKKSSLWTKRELVRVERALVWLGEDWFRSREDWFGQEESWSAANERTCWLLGTINWGFGYGKLSS
jgi:hypothetical protein